MKKSISLVEVLISIMLMSVVIVSMLQMKENNLNFLLKGEESIKNNSYISTVAINNSKNIENKNLYLDKEIDFKDDDIRKVFKNIKIKLKEKELDPIVFNSDNYSLTIKIKQSDFTINDKVKKTFYRFSLGE